MIPAAAIVLAVILAYLPAVQGAFIWDDPRYVSENACLVDAEGLSRIWTELGATVQYYPMVFTTFWIEYHIWQLDTAGYHTVNIVLHALAAVLLWLVLRRLSLTGAWLAAAVFALHPVQVESVAWITERKNVLAGAFYMAALLSYLHFDPLTGSPGAGRRRWGFYAISLLLFLGALFSKTVTCSLPAAILLLIWWKRGRLCVRSTLPLIPMFILGAALARVTTWMEENIVRAVGPDWAISGLERCLIAGRAVWFYIWKLMLPVRLTFNYPRWEIDPGIWWQHLFPLAALALVVTLWLLRKRIGRGPLVATLFYGGTLLPALGFTNTYPMRYSFVADHFVYLAAIGPIALASALLTKALLGRGRSPVKSGRGQERSAVPTSAWVVGAVGLLVLAALTSSQARIYESRRTIWLDTLGKNPSSFLAHNNLATIYLDQGDTDLALRHLREAIRLKPAFHEARWNLGKTLVERGLVDEGKEHLVEALRLKPDAPEVHNNLANVLASEGKFAEAAEHYEAAIRNRPLWAMPHNNLGNILAQQERFADAVFHYREAIRLQPGYARALMNLGLALAARGERDDAIGAFRQALVLEPGDAATRFNLGELLEERGEVDAAIREYRAVLRINPRHGPALRALDGLAPGPGPGPDDSRPRD